MVDAGIASLALLARIIALEELADHEVPENLFAGDITLQEVYEYYEVLANHDVFSALVGECQRPSAVPNWDSGRVDGHCKAAHAVSDRMDS